MSKCYIHSIYAFKTYRRAMHYYSIVCSNTFLATPKMDIIQLCSQYTVRYQLEVMVAKCGSSVVWQWHSDVYTLWHTQLAGDTHNPVLLEYSSQLSQIKENIQASQNLASQVKEKCTIQANIKTYHTVTAQPTRAWQTR